MLEHLGVEVDDAIDELRADAQIAQLAGADAAARQRSGDRATTLIVARRLDSQADEVVADRGL
jgi:hypothetical protein